MSIWQLCVLTCSSLVNLYGTMHFLDLGVCLLSHVREISALISSYTSSSPLSHSSPFWATIMQLFNIVVEVSLSVLISLYFFFVLFEVSYFKLPFLQFIYYIFIYPALLQMLFIVFYFIHWIFKLQNFCLVLSYNLCSLGKYLILITTFFSRLHWKVFLSSVIFCWVSLKKKFKTILRYLSIRSCTLMILSGQ